MTQPTRCVILSLVILLFSSCSSTVLSVVDFTIRQTAGNDYFKHVSMGPSAPLATGNIAENMTFHYFNTGHSINWNGNVSVTANTTLSSRIIYDNNSSKVVLGFTTNAGTLNYQTDSYTGSKSGSFGGNDIVLGFFNISGSLLNQTRYGAAYDEQLFALTSDSLGIYAGGIFSNSTSVGGIGTMSSNGGNDMWVAMYDHSGNHIWSTTFGGTSTDTLADIESDGSSYLYVAGNFKSPSITCWGSSILQIGSYQNGILAQFDKSGICNQAIQGSGSEDTTINALAVEAGFPNRIYIVGSGANVNFGGVPATGNTQDAFIFRFDAFLTAAWGIAIGSNSDTQQGLDIYASLGTVFMLGSYQYPFNYSGIFSNSSSRPSAFISQHNVNNGNVTTIIQVSFDQFDLVPYSLTVGTDGALVLGGSLQGSGTLAGQSVTTQQKDAVVLFLASPSTSPSVSPTPTPSVSPSRSPPPSPAISTSPTPSVSPQYSTTPTSSATPTASVSATPSPSSIPSASTTPSNTPSASSIPSVSVTPSGSVTPSTSGAPATITVSATPTSSVSVTPALSSSATPSVSTGPEDSSSTPVAVIAGSAAAAGSGCCTLFFAVGLVFWCRKKKKHDDDTSEEEEDDDEELAPVQLS